MKKIWKKMQQEDEAGESWLYKSIRCPEAAAVPAACRGHVA